MIATLVAALSGTGLYTAYLLLRLPPLGSLMASLPPSEGEFDYFHTPDDHTGF